MAGSPARTILEGNGNVAAVTSGLLHNIEEIVRSTLSTPPQESACRWARLLEDEPFLLACETHWDAQAPNQSGEERCLPIGSPPAGWIKASISRGSSDARELAESVLSLAAAHLAICAQYWACESARYKHQRETIHDLGNRINAIALKATVLRNNLGEQESREVEEIRSRLLQLGGVVADLARPIPTEAETLLERPSDS